MATKSSTSSNYKSNNRYAANRKARLERTLKKQPNNEQVKMALKDNKSYSRKTPNAPFWSHSMIREAKLFKEVTGKMDVSIFSSTESVRSNARLHMRSDHLVNVPQGKVSFLLGARAHDKQGNLVWG
jgi:hypothetical protein